MTHLFLTYCSILDRIGLRRLLLRIHSNVPEKELLGMTRNTYLENHGWHLSMQKNQSLDSEGNPIPWMTYPFLDFITSRLSSDFNVFEFGSGNSTLFFAKYVEQVATIEHNLEWFNEVSAKKPQNVRLLYEPSYETAAYFRSCLLQGKRFEIIVVDGRNRVACVKNSVDCLTDDGVLILDNSDRKEYRAAGDFMKENGFRCIEFFGMAALVSHTCCTSIYYRSNNCLGI